jgi:opacity protein-like surface antigen
MKRTCQTIIALCLPLLLCSHVRAEHSGPYVGAFFGGSALMNAKSTDTKGDSGLTFKPAMLGSAVIGWDLEPGNPAGEGRIELEYSRSSNPLDKVKFSPWTAKGGGKVTSDSLLLSCIGVARDSSSWSPYFGVGAGAARIKAANLTVTGQPLVNGSDVVFAFQVQTGVDVAVSDHLSFDLGYRFFGSAAPRFSESKGLKSSMDYLSHSAVLGLRVGF